MYYDAIVEAIAYGREQGMTLDAVARALKDALEKPEEIALLIERLSV